MEPFNVVCHVIVVTVDFQARFEDLLVCDLVLMALPFLFLSFVYRTRRRFLCVLRQLTCPCSFLTKCHVNLLVNNNINNNNNNVPMPYPHISYTDSLRCVQVCR